MPCGTRAVGLDQPDRLRHSSCRYCGENSGNVHFPEQACCEYRFLPMIYVSEIQNSMACLTERRIKADVASLPAVVWLICGIVTSVKSFS